MANGKGVFAKDKIVLQATDGHVLPVRYKGEWVKVRKDAPVEFNVADIPYESKIEIQAALKAKEVVEAVMPVPAPAAKIAAAPKVLKEK